MYTMYLRDPKELCETFALGKTKLIDAIFQLKKLESRFGDKTVLNIAGEHNLKACGSIEELYRVLKEEGNGMLVKGCVYENYVILLRV